jgi:hypothetical protein
MSVPNTPPPRRPRSGVVTALLLIVGILLLAPGVCALFFIPIYVSSPSQVPSGIMQIWVISFIISALGIALIVFAARR